MSAQDRHWKYKNLYWDYDSNRWEWLRKKRPIKHICLARGCADPAELSWSGKIKPKLLTNPFCVKCKRRRWRVNNPYHYTWSELKHSAHRRHIPFGITYGEFVNFCLENDLYRNSYKFTPQSLTVDRKDVTKGYFIWNLQILTHIENITKGNKERHQDQPNDDPF